MANHPPSRAYRRPTRRAVPAVLERRCGHGPFAPGRRGVPGRAPAVLSRTSATGLQEDRHGGATQLHLAKCARPCRAVLARWTGLRPAPAPSPPLHGRRRLGDEVGDRAMRWGTGRRGEGGRRPAPPKSPAPPVPLSLFLAWEARARRHRTGPRPSPGAATVASSAQSASRTVGRACLRRRDGRPAQPRALRGTPKRQVAPGALTLGAGGSQRGGDGVPPSPRDAPPALATGTSPASKSPPKRALPPPQTHPKRASIASPIAPLSWLSPKEARWPPQPKISSGWGGGRASS